MIRHGDAAGAIGRSAPLDRIPSRGQLRRHGPLRAALHALVAFLKVCVALPLGIAVAVAVWLIVQLLKL